MQQSLSLPESEADRGPGRVGDPLHGFGWGSQAGPQERPQAEPLFLCRGDSRLTCLLRPPVRPRSRFRWGRRGDGGGRGHTVPYPRWGSGSREGMGGWPVCPGPEPYDPWQQPRTHNVPRRRVWEWKPDTVSSPDETKEPGGRSSPVVYGYSVWGDKTWVPGH